MPAGHNTDICAVFVVFLHLLVKIRVQCVFGFVKVKCLGLRTIVRRCLHPPESLLPLAPRTERNVAIELATNS